MVGSPGSLAYHIANSNRSPGPVEMNPNAKVPLLETQDWFSPADSSELSGMLPIKQ